MNIAPRDNQSSRAPVAQDAKLAIIEQAKQRIIDGDTLNKIAADHGITSRTLKYWLSSLGDEYEQLRKAWIDSMLADATDAIDRADDAFPLARAREQFKAAAWYAERRDKRYQPKQDQSSSGVTIVINTQDSRGVLIQGDGGVLQAGGGELGEASSCMPSSTDNGPSTQVVLPNTTK